MCADRSGGVLPGKGRIDPGGEASVPELRGPGRVPGVRARARRAVRHLGRNVRTRTAPPEAPGRVAAVSEVVSGPCPPGGSGVSFPRASNAGRTSRVHPAARVRAVYL